MTERSHCKGPEPLTDEQLDSAAFRARDLLWAVIGDLFDQRREEDGLSFAELGRRIGRKRGQIQRWLNSPSNLTLQSAGLLVEGLDADLHISVQPRTAVLRVNYAHPCIDAAEGVQVDMSEFKPRMLTSLRASDSQLSGAPRVAFQAKPITLRAEVDV